MLHQGDALAGDGAAVGGGDAHRPGHGGLPRLGALGDLDGERVAVERGLGAGPLEGLAVGGVVPAEAMMRWTSPWTRQRSTSVSSLSA